MSVELDAWKLLAQRGAIPATEEFSPAKAKESHYTALLKKHRKENPEQQEDKPVTYRALVSAALGAIRSDNEDAFMAIRSEIIGEFKRSDTQITAALFELLTEQETGVKRSADSWKGSIDLSAVEGLDALVDGAIPANDIALTYGAKGAGKTAAALALSFAVIDGTGFLDHSKPTNPGSVLFIASDSGTAPLVSEMQRMGLSDHLAVKEGPGKRFHR